GHGRELGGDGPLHLSWLPVPGGRSPAHQLPSAEIDAADARLCVRRPRHHAARLPACGREPLPFLFVRRRDADRAMKFRVTHRDDSARRGVLELAHGRVDTPAFMPVGTYGTVKAMSPEELRAIGTQIVLGNTFHLW